MTANQATQEVIKTFESVTADLWTDEYISVMEALKADLDTKLTQAKDDLTKWPN